MKDYEPNIDGQVSEWNEAMFKMLRLHRIQTEINVSLMNPLQKNEENNYNYLAAFNLLCRLYNEGKSKYRSTEIVEVDTIKDVIEKMIIKFPVHNFKLSDGYNGTKKVDIYNPKNWKVIKSLLEIFETKIKYYNDIHGLSTKNAENLSGGSIIR